MALSDRNSEGQAGDMARDLRLDRAYREAGDVAPPAHLDAAILAAAHREVGARPRSLSSGLRRWRVPVSIAVVVVLSFSLVTLVREEGGEALVQIPPSAPLPKPQGDAAPPPASKPAPSDAARPAARPAAPAPQRAASRDDAPTVAELGQVAGRQAEAVSQASSGAGAAASTEAATRPAPEPFLAAPRDTGELRAAAPATPPRLEDSAPPPPPSAAVRRSAQPLAKGPASEPDRVKAMAKTAESASARQNRLPVWRDFENEPPQKWLERIEDLKRQERAADAADMLAEFKRRFPSHPLPPGLQ